MNNMLKRQNQRRFINYKKGKKVSGILGVHLLNKEYYKIRNKLGRQMLYPSYTFSHVERLYRSDLINNARVSILVNMTPGSTLAYLRNRRRKA